MQRLRQILAFALPASLSSAVFFVSKTFVVILRTCVVWPKPWYYKAQNMLLLVTVLALLCPKSPKVTFFYKFKESNENRNEEIKFKIICSALRHPYNIGVNVWWNLEHRSCSINKCRYNIITFLNNSCLANEKSELCCP